MKNFHFLLTVLALASMVFFTACQKEELNNPAQLAGQNELSVQDRAAECFPIWYFGDYPNCSNSANSHCDLQFPDFPSELTALNAASGTAYVNEAEELVIELDQVNFDEALENDILTTQTLTVVEAIEFPQELISTLYQNAGFDAPEATFGLAAGVYPVELEEIEDPAPTARRIKKKITRYNRDGSVRSIRYKYYRN